MNEAKILACPCGGEPELIEENTDMNLSLKGVRCKKCGLAIPIIHDHAPEAIQAWNDWAGGRKPEPSVEAGDKRIALQGLVRLLESATLLNEIVEGVRNERWSANGKRLKDTPEWCDFYCKLKAAAQQPNS